MDVSIIIATRNRAHSLSITLHRMFPVLKQTRRLSAELLVVDNASSDLTPEVVRWYSEHFGIPVRYIRKNRVGCSRARNRGMAEAKGKVFVFVDDDSMPTHAYWLEQLCLPVLDGSFSGVTGKIVLPPHLLRPWMMDWHRLWMASTEEYENGTSEPWFIGANMAVSADAARAVPGGFEERLGPGAAGYGEETLFCHELRKRGHRIGFVPSAEVLHCMDPARLSRTNWLGQAMRRGRSCAWQDYFWGKPLPEGGMRREMVLTFIRLWRSRIKRPGLLLHPEMAPVWELVLVSRIAYCRAVLQIKAEGLGGRPAGGPASAVDPPKAKQ